MLFTLIYKEIVSHVLSLRFMMTLVVLVGLIQISIFVVSSRYTTHLQTFNESQTHSRDRLEDHGIDLLHQEGVYGNRRPEPLSPFVFGLEARVPFIVSTTGSSSRSISEPDFRNPLFDLFTTPDFSYVVNLVASLLAVLFVFDSICGEKERGTLKLLMAQAVPRDTVLLAKWLGGYIALAIPFLVAVLGGLSYVYVTGVFVLVGDDLSRLGLLLALSLLYLAACFAMGMFISTVTHKSSTSLLIALFAWVCWLVVIPNLSPVLAERWKPVPTQQIVSAEKASVDRETRLRVERVHQNMWGTGKKAEEAEEEIRQEGNRRKDKLDHYYQQSLNDQIELSKALTRLSPAASFTLASTEIAQTGVSLFARFEQSYKRFQSQIEDYSQAAQKVHEETGEPVTADWFDENPVPQLYMTQLRLDDTVEAISTDLLLLGIYCVLFFLLSYLFFLRYDVS